jgi:hypothetical protein
LDKTNYLNHYYFSSILAFLLLFLPLDGRFSLNAWRKKSFIITSPRYSLLTLRILVGLVYCFAGIAKLKYDWLFEAQPLRIWLATRTNFPVLGPLFAEPLTAYVFSWAGMLFDLTIPFWLSWRRTRMWAYAAVVVFHLLTWGLFNIGLFPWIMMTAALIFFPAAFHERILKVISQVLGKICKRWPKVPERIALAQPMPRGLLAVLGVFFCLQVLLPLRHLVWPGDVLHNEAGYRFSWNVMLMEKNGHVDFWVIDSTTNRRWLFDHSRHLTALQYKQMSTQPDMILQFAEYVQHVEQQRIGHIVTVQPHGYVAQNGRPAIEVMLNP